MWIIIHPLSLLIFFIGNVAKDNNGGALYAKEDVYVSNAMFDGNKADKNDNIYAKGEIYKDD